jgi:hypothetical protein
VQQVITVNSLEYAAVHEGGHAAAAIVKGAIVVEMELYPDPVRNSGRTRVCRNEDQARFIALGGFAAEYLLFRANRLVGAGGLPISSDKEFIDIAFRNAADDYQSFWINHAGSADSKTTGIPEVEMDRQFMKFAIGFAEKSLSIGSIERLADALLAKGKLEQQAIADAWENP